jgi:heat shock protein HslJ
MIMKHWLLYTVLACAVLLGLTSLNACGQNEPAPKSPAAGQAEAQPSTPDAQPHHSGTITDSDLLHRRFILREANGMSFEGQEKVPSLEFNEGFRLSGAVCNRFSAQGELKDGVLRARQAASTKMLCLDADLNQLESDFYRLLQDGAALELDGKYLRLTGKGGDKPMRLEYEQRDWVQ